MPLDMGWWIMRDGRRRLMTYWADCGALTLDGPGGLDVLARCADEDDVRKRLDGWENHCDRRDGLTWVTGQLQGCR